MSDETAATPVEFDPVPAIASHFGLPPKAVAAVVALLDEGGTVPFIARYRKERTGGLDEVAIRNIEEHRTYVVELETRRAAILASVTEQGKLSPELEGKLRAATSKAELEDLYAPYRPRRKTRASMARDKGLEPLAHRIQAQGAEGDPAAEAAAFLKDDVATAEDALAGARDIVAEGIADTAEVRAFVRREFADTGELISEVVPGKDNEPTKFEQYYKFGEAVRAIPSHRFLAIRRGEAEGVLRAHVAVDTARVAAGIERLAKLDPASPWAAQLQLAAADALKRLLAPSVENDVRAELKLRSDQAAVDIFAGNLRNLLLAAPLGSASVLGVDPGLRTGCKCAAIDATGKFLGTITIYITQGEAQAAKAREEFLAFVQQFTPRAIAIGNGTGGREAEQFVKKVLGDAGMRGTIDPNQLASSLQVSPFVVQVNEAGASVYSASDLAREEFPELDLTIRGAISIARRLQDPLAELVKIESKSIGVGQYQHDVQQTLLGKKLDDVVEDCVNHVGVELNTASAQLLGYVAGIGKSLAKKLVLHRDTNGKFGSRSQLLEVSGLGPKAFEQCAGFLRIANAQHPLDTSGVHPERYPLVEQMAKDAGVALWQLIGNQELVDKLDLTKYITEDVGEPTLRDITAELTKPGRDPRAEFEPPKFRDDVSSVEDLKQGMVLEGIVTNVTAFGAFVDIGVHNDGLVHVSQLSDQFVKDPTEVVKVGQKLTVRVLEVDLARKRIALSAKRGGQPRPRNEQQQGGQGGNQQQQQGQNRNGGNNRRGGRGRGGGQQGNQGNQQQGNQQQGRGNWQPGDQGNQQGRGTWQPGDPQGHGGNPGGTWQQGDPQQGRGTWQPGDQPGEQHGEQQARPQHGDQRQEGGGPQQQGGDNRQRRQWQERGPEGGPPQEGAPPQHVEGQPHVEQRGPRGPRGPRNPNQGGGQQRNDRGPNQGGGQQRGPNDRNFNNGPRSNGPNFNDRGPRGGGGPNDRGPNDRGPNDRGPNDRGPNDRGPNDRGPNDRGPNDRNFNDRGPRGGGPTDRAPRRDEGPKEKWGVSGFVNNPFAKLKEDDKKS